MTGKTKVAGGGAAAKRAYWGKRITEWERSGQTQKAFCAQRGLALSTFQWWRMRGKRCEAMKGATPFLPIARSTKNGGWCEGLCGPRACGREQCLEFS